MIDMAEGTILRVHVVSCICDSFKDIEDQRCEALRSAALKQVASLRADLERADNRIAALVDCDRQHHETLTVLAAQRDAAQELAAGLKVRLDGRVELHDNALALLEKAEAQRDAARGDLSALIGMTPPDQGMLTAWLCPECWYLDDRPPKEDKCHPKPGTTLAVCDVTMHRIAWAAAGAKMLKELKAARAALAATKPEGGAS